MIEQIKLLKAREPKYFNARLIIFSNQRNFAIDNASNDWIFFIDADELASDDLKRNIKELLRNGTNNAGFRINRANYFMGKEMRFGGAGGDKVLRLFNKRSCRYGTELVHEKIYTNGEIGELGGVIKHNTYSDLDSYVAKMNHYTTLSALQKNPNKDRKITLPLIIIKMLAKFIKFYILKLGFLDGKVGFISAYLTSFDSFLRSVKMWRLSEGEEQ